MEIRRAAAIIGAVDNADGIRGIGHLVSLTCTAAEKD